MAEKRPLCIYGGSIEELKAADTLPEISQLAASISDGDTTHAPDGNSVFNALALKVPTSRTISTTSPITGGGDLSSNRTIAIPAATNAVPGYATAAHIAAIESNTSRIGDIEIWKIGYSDALALKAPLASPTFSGTVNLSGATVTLADNQISGDKVHGGTISNFASTGIDDNATAVAITINAQGFMGLGTTNPIGRFHSAQDGLSSHGFESASDNIYYRPVLTSMRASGTLAAKTAVVNGSILGSFYYQGYDGTEYISGAIFSGVVDGAVSAGLVPTAFTIATRDVAGGNPIERVRVSAAGNLGLWTTTPTNILSLGGNAARTIWMERHTTSNTAGNSLTIQAGSATVGATNKAGGQLILMPGISTGTGESGVTIQGCVAGATGTADRTMTDVIKVLGNKIGFFGVTPVARLAYMAPVADLTTVCIRFNYLCSELEGIGLLSREP